MPPDTPFDSDHPTLPAWILGITERIWEGRDIGLIRDTYGPDVVMRTGLGISAGVDAVVAGTLSTLHAFPDRRLLGEDVIWSGDGTPGRGYSSHRIVSTQHHRGDGLFGPPTGRAVMARTIADCRMAPGPDGRPRIVEEWLVRDQSAIALQLGLDPAEFARGLVPASTASEPDEIDNGLPVDDGTAGWRCAAAMRRIWGETDLSAIRRHYDPAVTLHLPGGRVAAGHDGLDGFVVGYLAAFPDARLAIDHVITRTDPGRPVRVALRWRLAGTHDGRGAFGSPSGARVTMLGIIHNELVEDRVTRSFVLVDELAVWAAIAAARG